MGSPSGTTTRTVGKGFSLSGFLRQVLEELNPLPDRAGVTFRIVFASLLVWIIVLTFRNPLGDVGVFLVMLVLQRNKTMTRLPVSYTHLTLPTIYSV